MHPQRRACLLALAAGSLSPGRAVAATDAAGSASAKGTDPDPVRRGRALQFPRDHGAHPATRTEWWYATGWLGTPQAPTHGVQVTFFRSATRLAAASTSRFAARHLLFAHAAVTELAIGRHRHVQRIARWSGDPTARPDAAALDDAALRLGPWSMARTGAAGQTLWRARVVEEGFDLALTLQPTQPLLLQGDAGFSRKGPEEAQASHYYSEPQLLLQADGRIETRALQGQGRAWLDHEWSEQLLHPEAVGWDWIGMNLFDGSALTVFRLRRADGSALWAGGSLRRDGVLRAFSPGEVAFTPGRRWRSAATRADYPVQWQLTTPAGPFTVRALLDTQELSGHGTFGAIYWEGLSELLDAAGRRIGLGYLEMTGYAARLRIG